MSSLSRFVSRRSIFFSVPFLVLHAEGVILLAESSLGYTVAVSFLSLNTLRVSAERLHFALCV